jgi:hypothetical protein
MLFCKGLQLLVADVSIRLLREDGGREIIFIELYKLISAVCLSR